MSMNQVERYRARMTHDNLWPAAQSAAEAAESLSRLADGTAPVLTWTSNGRHPMDDMLAAWLVLGVISEAQAQATTDARQRDMDAFLTAYRASPPQPDAEQLAEMRAAFGPGANVVNAVTGQSRQL